MQTIKRRYIPIEEAAAACRASVGDVIHAAAQGDFPVHVLADNWALLAYVRHAETSEWMPASPQPSNKSGPLRLYPESLLRFEANPAVSINSFVGESEEEPCTPEEEWEYRLANGGVVLADCKLVIMENVVQLYAPIAACDADCDSEGSAAETNGDENKSGQKKLKDRVSVLPLSSLSDDEYIREKQLLEYLPFSKATLYRKILKQNFPASVKLSEGVSAWRVIEVKNWFAKH